MRPVRKITAAEENFRMEPVPDTDFSLIRRDPVEPEPVGTIILQAFRISGYGRDCDGSLMARLENIDKNGEPTGWETKCIGLYPDTSLVISKGELRNIFAKDAENDRDSDR